MLKIKDEENEINIIDEVTDTESIEMMDESEEIKIVHLQDIVDSDLIIPMDENEIDVAEGDHAESTSILCSIAEDNAPESPKVNMNDGLVQIRRRYSNRRSEGLAPVFELLDNCLVKNPSYYKPTSYQKGNYTVCIYGQFNDTEIGKTESKKRTDKYLKLEKNEKNKVDCKDFPHYLAKLKYQHFADLQNNEKCLKNTTIDAFLLTLLKEYSSTLHITLVVRTDMALRFINAINDFNKLTKNSIYAIENMSKVYEDIVIPILDGGHFVLVIINNIIKTFDYYDSLPGAISTSRRNQIISKLKQNFLNQYNVLKLDTIDIKKYELRIIKCNKQSDTINCGPAICYFATKYMSGDQINLTYDVQNFREEMMNIFLKNSHSVENHCIICDVNDFNYGDSNWVQCDYCERWYHTICYSKHVKKTAMTIIEGNLVCELCEKNKLTLKLIKN